MRHLTLAGAMLAALILAASVANADSYYGPRKVANQCWHGQTGVSLGYWAPCEAPKTAQATATRGKKR